jgi:hypothetical protein
VQRPQIATAAAAPTPDPPILNPAIVDPRRPIRARLTSWQDQFGGPNDEDLRVFENYVPGRNADDISNGMASRMTFGIKSDEESGSKDAVEEEDGDNHDEDVITLALFLKPGDVVELS